MKILIVETAAEAGAVAPILDSDWRVVPLGEQAALTIDRPKWWVDPTVSLSAKGVRALDKGLHGESVERVYLSFPYTLHGGATSKVLTDLLTSRGLVKNKIRRVDFSKVKTGEVSKAIDKGVTASSDEDYEAYRWASAIDAVMSKSISDALTEKFSYPVHLDRLQAFCLEYLSDVEKATRFHVPVKMWVTESTLSDGTKLRSETCSFPGAAVRYVNMIEKGETRIRFRTKEEMVQPPSPCKTWSLVSEAHERWGLTSIQTMDAADKLYQEGIITYPWTDGSQTGDTFRLSVKAMLKSQGKGGLYTPRPGRGAMAILPKDLSVLPKQNLQRPRKNMATPVAHVYAIIWERAVASQMAEAQVQLQQLQLVAVSNASRVLGNIRGEKVLKPGFRSMRPVKGGAREISRESFSVKKTEVVEVLTSPPDRITESGLLVHMVERGVNSSDALATLKKLWSNGYIRAVAGGIAPTPNGEALSSFVRKNLRFVTDPKFIETVEAGVQKVREGSLEGAGWTKTFIGSVLMPHIQKAKDAPATSDMPYCRRTFTNYDVRLTDNGPEFYNVKSKDAIAIEVDAEGNMVPFRARAIPGDCTVCGHTVAMLSRSKGEDYVSCAACGTRAP